MKALIIPLLGFLLLVASCANEVDRILIPETPPSTVVVEQSPFKITKEQALRNLEGLINSFDSPGNELRSTSGRSLRDLVSLINPDSLQSVTRRNAGLRSSTLEEENRELLYVANFLNDQGYAILAADSRIPDPVICVTEQGSMSPEDFNGSTALLSEADIQKEIKDFSLYNAEHDDYYVGGVIDVLERGGHNGRPEVISNMLLQYAEDMVEGGGNPSPPSPSNLYPQYGEWITVEGVNALLRTKWHQGSPFNDEMPIVRKYVYSGPKGRAPAGCIPIAMAQIMAYNGLPKKIRSVSSEPMPWDEIRAACTYETIVKNPIPYTDVQKKMLSALLRAIAGRTTFVYTTNFSLGLPKFAFMFLVLSEGYKNVREMAYSQRVIEEMLDRNRPVIVVGFSSDLVGHAWVIDGCIIQGRSKKIKGVSGEILNQFETRKLVHCNFGWGGVADGYYSPGVFDTSNGPEAHDYVDRNTGKSDTHFNWVYKMIVYDISKDS